MLQSESFGSHQHIFRIAQTLIASPFCAFALMGTRSDRHRHHPRLCLSHAANRLSDGGWQVWSGWEGPNLERITYK